MIPVSRPDFGPAERKAICSVMESGWVTRGWWCEELEKLWARRCEVRYCASVANGTVALQLALEALGLPDGSEVIVPTATYCATASAVIHARLHPVFVGCGPNGEMDVDAARQARTRKTRAVVVVHLYGNPDVAAVELKREPGLVVVEDCAEAHGARLFGDLPVGSLGAVAAWSFYANKIVAAGEGGAVTTDNEALIARARLLRGQGVGSLGFVALEAGHNFRMTDLHAALAVCQTRRMAELLGRRREVRAWYAERLADRLMPRAVGGVDWMINVRVGDADMAADRLRQAGVETRPWFPPLHKMPAFAGYDYIGDDTAERLHREVLSLPTSSTMTQDDVAVVCRALEA